MAMRLVDGTLPMSHIRLHLKYVFVPGLNVLQMTLKAVQSSTCTSSLGKCIESYFFPESYVL